MHSSTTQDTTTKLQFTRRGKLALAGLILLLLAAYIALTWSKPAVPPAIAADDRQPATYQQIMIQPGDTLWGISSRVAQGSDQAMVLEHIVAYNDLDSSELEVGQTLYVPVNH